MLTFLLSLLFGWQAWSPIQQPPGIYARAPRLPGPELISTGQSHRFRHSVYAHFQNNMRKGLIDWSALPPMPEAGGVLR